MSHLYFSKSSFPMCTGSLCFLRLLIDINLFRAFITYNLVIPNVQSYMYIQSEIVFEWFVTYITSIKFVWIVSFNVKLQHSLVRKPLFRINDILVLAHYALIECASSKWNCDSKFCSQNSQLSTFLMCDFSKFCQVRSSSMKPASLVSGFRCNHSRPVLSLDSSYQQIPIRFSI